MGLELRARHRHGVVVRRVRVAQSRQHICDGICHRHDECLSPGFAGPYTAPRPVVDGPLRLQQPDGVTACAVTLGCSD
ncbi:hypothetical protein ACFPRL_25130 [Pseudoclavibacter helvolus]